jgi:hypothetical protein
MAFLGILIEVLSRTETGDDFGAPYPGRWDNCTVRYDVVNPCLESHGALYLNGVIQRMITSANWSVENMDTFPFFCCAVLAGCCASKNTHFTLLVRASS